MGAVKSQGEHQKALMAGPGRVALARTPRRSARRWWYSRWLDKRYSGKPRQTGDAAGAAWVDYPSLYPAPRLRGRERPNSADDFGSATWAQPSALPRRWLARPVSCMGVMDVAAPISCSNWPGNDSHLRRELNSNPGTVPARARRSRAAIG